MIQEPAYIFIDEMKNNSMDSNVVCNNNYYTYAAVVVSESNVPKFRELHNCIVSKYFKQVGYLKSTSISRKGQWMDIANTYKQVEHYVAYLVIDMSKINGNGLINHKPSFEKYFQNIINKRFLTYYNQAHVIMDEQGSSLFKSSIESYMGKKGFGVTLFSSNSFKFKDDKVQEPLLQVADYYVGIIGRYMRQAPRDSIFVDIYNSVKDRLIASYFPNKEIQLRISEELPKLNSTCKCN